MKKILCLIMLILVLFMFSINSFADCTSTFNSGVSNARVGSTAAKMAQESFKEMKSLAAANASDNDICEKGREARMTSFLAAKNYKRARASFLSAIDQCGSPNDKVAAEAADQSTTAYNSNAEFVGQLDNLLLKKCGSEPLSPILNKDE